MRTKMVRIWMLQKDIRAIDVARACGVSRGYVSNVLAGRKSGNIVCAWLMGQGCPPEFFESEDDLKEEHLAA